VSETKERERESVGGGRSPAEENKRKNVALKSVHENKELCQRREREIRALTHCECAYVADCEREVGKLINIRK
jgi:hypothetical protein